MGEERVPTSRARGERSFCLDPAREGPPGVPQDSRATCCQRYSGEPPRLSCIRWVCRVIALRTKGFEAFLDPEPHSSLLGKHRQSLKGHVVLGVHANGLNGLRVVKAAGGEGREVTACQMCAWPAARTPRPAVSLLETERGDPGPSVDAPVSSRPPAPGTGANFEARGPGLRGLRENFQL